MANKFSANEEKWEIIGPRFLGQLERKGEKLSFSIGKTYWLHRYLIRRTAGNL